MQSDLDGNKMEKLKAVAAFAQLQRKHHTLNNFMNMGIRIQYFVATHINTIIKIMSYSEYSPWGEY